MAENVKTVQGLAIASVKTLQGLAIADAKSIMGVDNTSGSFSPPDISGLVLWLKADGNVYNTGTTQATDGQTVTTWSDASVSANDATQATGGSKPTFQTNEINSLPVVRFDGSDDFMVGGAISVSAATLFVVCQATSQASSWNLFEVDAIDDYWYTAFGGNEGYFGVFRTARIDTYPNSAIPNSGVNLFTVKSSASTYEVRVNGVSAGAQSASFSAGTKFVIGVRGSEDTRFFAGDVCEIIVYDSALSGGDITTVETYLRSAARWNF